VQCLGLRDVTDSVTGEQGRKQDQVWEHARPV
jgi:hypothetical protein